MTYLSQLLPSPFKGVNPDGIKSLDVIPTILGNLIEIFLVLGGIFAVLVIIWAGINYIVSQGDPGRTKDAKNTILYAVVGLILSAGSYMLVEFVLGRLV
jgi:hypothetical protein